MELLLSSDIPFNLRKLREAAGLTRNQLAEMSDVSLPFIQLIETGKANPSWKVISAISETLGLEIKVKPSPANWDALAAHGAPLLTMKDQTVRPSQKSLLRNLWSASRELQSSHAIPDRERKVLAVQALCWAIQSEFPSFFNRYLAGAPLIADFIPREPSGPLIKLRRRAAAKLAEYL